MSAAPRTPTPDDDDDRVMRETHETLARIVEQAREVSPVVSREYRRSATHRTFTFRPTIRAISPLSASELVRAARGDEEESVD